MLLCWLLLLLVVLFSQISIKMDVQRMERRLKAFEPSSLTTRRDMGNLLAELQVTPLDSNRVFTVKKKLQLLWQFLRKAIPYTNFFVTSYFLEALVKSCCQTLSNHPDEDSPCLIVEDREEEDNVNLAIYLLAALLNVKEKVPIDSIEGLEVDILSHSNLAEAYVHHSQAIFHDWNNRLKLEERLRLFLIITDRCNKNRINLPHGIWSTIFRSFDKIMYSRSLPNVNKIHIFYHFSKAIENMWNILCNSTNTGFDHVLKIMMTIIKTVDSTTPITSSVGICCLLATYNVSRPSTVENWFVLWRQLESIPSLTLKWAVWTGLCCAFIERMSTSSVQENEELVYNLRTFGKRLRYIGKKLPKEVATLANEMKSLLMKGKFTELSSRLTSRLEKHDCEVQNCNLTKSFPIRNWSPIEVVDLTDSGTEHDTKDSIAVSTDMKPPNLRRCAVAHTAKLWKFPPTKSKTKSPQKKRKSTKVKKDKKFSKPKPTNITKISQRGPPFLRLDKLSEHDIYRYTQGKK